MSKKLNKILEAKTWPERLALAEGRKSGTPFEKIFDDSKCAIAFLDQSAKRNETTGPQIDAANGMLATVGLFFADIISRRDSVSLDAVATEFSKWCKPVPHKRNLAAIVRAELIALSGMFPAGKPRLELVKGKIVEMELWPKLSVRIVEKAVLKSVKMQNNECEGANCKDMIRREIQRQARHLHIPLDTTPGRPGQKRTQKP